MTTRPRALDSHGGRKGRSAARRWHELACAVLDGRPITAESALSILRAPDAELLDLLAASFLVRRAHFGNEVRLHVIHSARTGGCSEDCGFCAQSSRAPAAPRSETLRTPERVIEGARTARELGAVRYCIVMSGRRASDADVERICQVIHSVKSEVSIEVCTSLGLISAEQARRLKAAGLDRYNHNLESSEAFFPNVCASHRYTDRVDTARAAKQAGLALCCGGIIGMGETLEDRVALAFATAHAGADSVPVNFFDPRPGTPLAGRPRPTPTECLRALAMFRFVHPRAEVRAAGGREACLGPLQALALYPANSMFTCGYLTTPGQPHPDDRRLIEAAGFRIGDLVHGA